MAEEMVIQPLGGGQEVGRSCILLQYQGRNIMLDCGCHPGREGNDSLPFFDSLDKPEDIDMILITHFHIDHCAALPYFTEKTDFQGRIFMTHATKAVMKLLLSDNIKLQFRTTPLYSEEDLQRCIDKVEVLDYHETIEHRGVKVTASAAGHVLGAAMFMIDIDGIRVLYTGDYSLEEDRHLIPAQVPPGGPPDVLIIESTFGITKLPPREKREEEFTAVVESIVARGGSCLIPVFALGRAQELLLILDEHWQESPELQNIPIFYASKLATKSLRVYQTFINMMNAHVRQLMDQFCNPFELKHIRNIAGPGEGGGGPDMLMGPCVVMASPGFMQSGVSRQLFEAWCDDERHGVVIAGYTVEGTLAGDLLSMPSEVVCLDNRIKPRRCQIEHISFSAHVDYTQNRQFMQDVLPDYIVLVHGEKTQMRRLKESLEADMRKGSATGWPAQPQHRPSIAMPENGVKVKLRFRKNVNADVVGSAAVRMLNDLDGEGERSEGCAIPAGTILVTEDFRSQLVAAPELSSYSSCKFGRICERLCLPLPQGWAQLSGIGAGGGVAPQPAPSKGKSAENKQDVNSMGEHSDGAYATERKLLELMSFHLEEVFDSLELSCYRNALESIGVGMDVGDGGGAAVKEEVEGRLSCLVVQGLVSISVGYFQGTAAGAAGVGAAPVPTHVLLRWRGSPVADSVADCAAGIVMQVFSTFQTLRRSLLSSSSGSGSRNETASEGQHRSRQSGREGLHKKRKTADAESLFS